MFLEFVFNYFKCYYYLRNEIFVEINFLKWFKIVI